MAEIPCTIMMCTLTEQPLAANSHNLDLPKNMHGFICNNQDAKTAFL